MQIAVEKPVEGHVALDADFREDDEVGVFSFGLLDAADDVVGVGLEVAVDGVDLADGDAHGNSDLARIANGRQVTLYSNSNCGAPAQWRRKSDVACGGVA